MKKWLFLTQKHFSIFGWPYLIYAWSFEGVISFCKFKIGTTCWMIQADLESLPEWKCGYFWNVKMEFQWHCQSIFRVMWEWRTYYPCFKWECCWPQAWPLMPLLGSPHQITDLGGKMKIHPSSPNQGQLWWSAQPVSYITAQLLCRLLPSFPLVSISRSPPNNWLPPSWSWFPFSLLPASRN